MNTKFVLRVSILWQPESTTTSFALYHSHQFEDMYRSALEEGAEWRRKYDKVCTIFQQARWVQYISIPALSQNIYLPNSRDILASVVRQPLSVVLRFRSERLRWLRALVWWRGCTSLQERRVNAELMKANEQIDMLKSTNEEVRLCVFC